MNSFISKTYQNRIGRQTQSAILKNKHQTIEYVRDSMFFISSKNYKSPKQDFHVNNINSKAITTIDFDCTGHGSFMKNSVALRFLTHLYDTIELSPNVNKIKLKISGFDLNVISQKQKTQTNTKSERQIKQKQLTLIQSKSEQQLKSISFIKRLHLSILRASSSLNSLQIRITNVGFCKLQDFQTVLSFVKSKNCKDLQNLSLQFSDWNFYVLKPISQNIINTTIIDEIGSFQNLKDSKTHFAVTKQQPLFNQFIKALEILSKFQKGSQLNNLKKVKLQFSTFYYNQKQCNEFLQKISREEYQQKKYQIGNKLIRDKKVEVLQKDGTQVVDQRGEIITKYNDQGKIPFFHYSIHKVIREIVQTSMPNLTIMHLDFRNWFNKFEMGQLKSYLMNIDKQPIDNNDAKSTISANSDKGLQLHMSLLGTLGKALLNVNFLSENTNSFKIMVVI